MENILLYFFSLSAIVFALLMLFLKHPMRVALSLVGVMISLAAIYALLGVHVVAVFQILIYVGAIMVLMIYVIMLLDIRDESFVRRYSKFLIPAGLFGILFLIVICFGIYNVNIISISDIDVNEIFTFNNFSKLFLTKYWFHFELTSVLLLVAIVGVMTVISGKEKKERAND